MVNFKPMQDHLMDCTWKLIEKYSAKDSFLDIGGGSGWLSLFLAKKGWQGTLIDESKSAITEAKQNLSGTPIEVIQGDVSMVKRKLGSVFLYDVIEHEKDDAALLRKARELLIPGGYLMLSVPMHTSEWRKDDYNYGHFRRYEPEELKRQLEKLGFTVLEMQDYTFPFFWLMRRLYTPFIKVIKGNTEEHTDVSYKNPLFCFFNKLLGWPSLWRPFNAFQDLFKYKSWGCQLLIIAKKK